MTANPAIDKVVQDELFAYIEEQLRDDQERLVIHLSFRVGLAPRLIAREYPEMFDSIAEIRRIKERVVLRLSTDLRLRDWWNPPTRLEARLVDGTGLGEPGTLEARIWPARGQGDARLLADRREVQAFAAV